MCRPLSPKHSRSGFFFTILRFHLPLFNTKSRSVPNSAQHCPFSLWFVARIVFSSVSGSVRFADQKGPEQDDSLHLSAGDTPEPFKSQNFSRRVVVHLVHKSNTALHKSTFSLAGLGLWELPKFRKHCLKKIVRYIPSSENENKAFRPWTSNTAKPPMSAIRTPALKNKTFCPPPQHGNSPSHSKRQILWGRRRTTLRRDATARRERVVSRDTA